MITYAQAMTANEFWHMTAKNADGTPVRARRNGKTATWKSKQGQFRIPVKRGLKDCFYISNFDGSPSTLNHHQRCTPERWEAEHQLFAGVTPT